MTTEITISPAGSLCTVRAGGAILGESRAALILQEGNMDPVIYFPAADIATAFLDDSDTTSHCPHKGDARYYSIQTKSTVIEDAAWSYETPHENVAEIAGHIAFFSSEKVTVEKL
ncbi:DUF427 domain-containing protein [Halocynthiibacter styelae]|uniref:DUF427 domain-containing protein n=1 Tax=Halocynthiibacter styelae TaxID=2761955 RepID=A0A8J7IVH9_9RHOB|nr:DUF427 domain-containing protein [Paenihalocynthiibacter styelae]MBI1493353.1 DUF427 domain-containing protein [Paenihalocynthiibacter styelae]